MRRGTAQNSLREDQSGFTLPEVTIVVVILGIVLAVASSSWLGTIEGRRVDSAANQLVSDLRLAHTSATNQLSAWAVVTDVGSFTATTGFTLPAGTPTGKDYYLIKVPDSGTTIVRVIARDLGDANGAQIAASTPISLRFKPDGSVRTENDGPLSNPVTLTVHKSGGSVTDSNRHTLRVNTVTSRVELVS